MRIAVPATLFLIGALAATSTGWGQELLERLQENLREAIAPEPLPPPQPLPAPASPTGPPRLGVVVDRVTRSAIADHGLVVRQGALITAVEPGSPADRAGLPMGGVIVAVDGVRVDSPNELIGLIRAHPRGQSVELSYYQGSRLYRKRLPLTPTRAATAVPPAAVPPRSAPSAANPTRPSGPLLDRLGRVLDTLTSPEVGREPAAPPPAAGTPVSTQLQRLEQQVGRLQAEVDRMRQRLAELENRLAE